ncbi:MAG: ABC transporter ATP-binding protein, partial [Clostridia bacterium]|nr:ABC transporter ATP-binding protein [Clostridia bacterium]
LMGTTSLVTGFSAPGKKEMAYVESALEQINIGYLRDRMFLNISGGERQLVLIARALAQQARILFMDEPTASLDYGNQIRVLEQMHALSREGYTVLQSTHNPDQALWYGGKVLAIRNRKILAFGPPEQVITAETMGQLYQIDVTVESLQNGNVKVCVPRRPE